MLLSEYIFELQVFKKSRGNIEVWIPGKEEGKHVPAQCPVIAYVPKADGISTENLHDEDSELPMDVIKNSEKYKQVILLE